MLILIGSDCIEYRGLFLHCLQANCLLYFRELRENNVNVHEINTKILFVKSGLILIIFNDNPGAFVYCQTIDLV